MCGIAALFAPTPCDLETPIQRMVHLARHRGPDGRGFVVGAGDAMVARDVPTSLPGSWALGHARLSILDLSEAGHQPMADETGRVWCTFNGEIYNFVELRRELDLHGHRFRTGTDTEVLIAAWRQWGPACVERFIGMFAFVLVDLSAGRCFAARDRLGIKPIYLARAGGLTAFVSEPKQLAALPGFEFQADREQVLDFLVDGVLGHDAWRSCFEGVEAVPAGHTLEWRLGESPRPEYARSYWDPETETVHRPWAESVERTRDLFENAVSLRMRADVPVGSCLSGGVDSSSIVGLAATGDAPFHSFTACFDDTRFDERPYVEAVRDHTGCVSHLVFPDPEALANELEALVYHQDEPFVSFSKYAQWCVMREAGRQGVTVLLDGQGGDEAFCGYRKFAFFFLKKKIQEGRLPEAFRHALGLLRNGDGRLFELSAGHRYLPSVLRQRFDPSVELLAAPARAERREAWRSRSERTASLHEHQLADFRYWSLPALLRYEDRNSMAHGIEARLPFLDHRLLEHLLSVPEEFFFSEGKTKPLLKAAVGPRLAPEVRNRKTKLGFDTPQDVWMRGDLGRLLEERTRTAGLVGSLLDRHSLDRAFAATRRGDVNAAVPRFLVRAASVALWERRFRLAA